MNMLNINKIYLISILFIVFPCYLTAANSSINVDSLNAYVRSFPEGNRLEKYIELIKKHRCEDYLGSFELIDIAIKEATKINDTYNLTQLIEESAYNYYLIGLYGKSRNLNIKALNMAEENKFNDLKAQIFNNLGQVYYEIGEYQNTIDCLLKAELYVGFSKNTEYHGILLNNIGTIYKLLKINELSIAYHQKAINLYQGKNTKLYIDSYLNLIHSLLMIDRIDEVEIKLREISESYGSNFNLNQKAQYYLFIGSIEIFKNQISKGKEKFKKAIELIEEGNNIELKEKVYKEFSTVLSKFGQYEEAVKYLTLFEKTKESRIRNKKLDSYKMIFERLEREGKNAEQKTIKLEAERIKSMEIQIIIVSLCIIILIIVIAFFRSRTTQEELSNKNLELKNINEKFNCFLEQSGEAFRIIDSDGKIILWNRANELLTGIKKSVALNQNFIDIAKILNSDFRQPTIDKISTLILKKTFQPFTVEKKIFTNSGEKKYVLESFFSIKTHDEILTGIISRDNTAKHQYEKELLAAKNKAEASEKIKTEFLAQMSHEIRTPINTILSYVALIEDELKNSENDLLIESFTSIHNSGDRIIRTVDLLLNMSEIQTGTYEPLIRKINLHKEIIRPLFLEYKMLAKSKGINLIQSIPSSELFVFADNYSISQILDNLISNAIKFTKKGTVEIFTGSDINVENEEYTYMGVRDTGIGMTKEFMEKMFSPFTQEEHGYTRSYEGNGLGLALVNQYCRINGIIIEVESKKNIGSCFTIKFINNTYLKNVNVDLCDEYENKYCVSN